MPSRSALTLKSQLLAGDLDSTALQTALGTATTLSAFRELTTDSASVAALLANSDSISAMLGSALARTALSESAVTADEIAESSYATSQACQNGTFLALIFNNGMADAWWETVERRGRLEAQVNASGSKLKTEWFYSSGTWTSPTTLLAISRSMIGGGASGCGAGSGSNNDGASGGGGAEAVTGPLNVSDVTGNLTITCGAGGTGANNAGADGADSTIVDGTNGTLATATGGDKTLGYPPVSGDSGYVGGLGGGTTSGGGRDAMTEPNFPRAIWQFKTATQKGGDGGNGRSVDAGYLGSAEYCLIPGTEGLPGFIDSTISMTPTGGKWGAGGGAIADNSGGSKNGGAGAYGGGGGAGSDGGNGGNGGTGPVAIHWIEE